MKGGFRGLLGLLMIGILYSCANIGMPNGGPYDELPPKFVSSTPAPNQVNFKGQKIEILFDELIQIEKPTENVIITPPQLTQPIIRAAGRKAVVELKDSLKEDVTYTIDFTNSISDNNEKNVFENFSFAFSTGGHIDTLEVSGKLLNAENLEPMPNITIGLHSNLDDTAFVKEPFLRTSRTNDKGHFTIRNIAPGTYHIFALNDLNRDYRFDQPTEEIAFSDSLIVPTFEFSTRQDTVWKDSLTVDTIKVVNYTRFMPDNIELFLFKEDFERQYMTRPERTADNRFTLKFNAKLDSMPDPIPLNFTPADSIWYIAQWADEGKSVNYWIIDSLISKQDTLQLEVNYLKSDSLNKLQPQTDTISATMRKRPAEAKKKKKGEEEEPIVFLGMNVNAPGSMDMTDTISIVFDEPVLDIKKDLFALYQHIDSVFSPVEFDFYPDSTNSLGYFISRKWNYEEEYRFEIDSATIVSIYGKWNDHFKSDFKIKKADEYGHLYLNIEGIDTTAYVELLNSGDAPVRKAKIKDGGVLFMDLKPDKYYARLVVDLNNNYKWDTGKYSEKLQPEQVYYCSKVFEVMQNWQVEETWNVTSTPFSKQKPLDITKNKPKEATKKKRDYRDEGRQQSSGRSGGGMGMPF